MGNPALAYDTLRPCIECAHCRGFRSAPGQIHGVSLCGYGSSSYTWWHGNIATGCRYWEPAEPAGEKSGEESDERSGP